MKEKTQYLCENCQARFSQWRGQCSNCGQWGTLQRVYFQGKGGRSHYREQEKRKPFLLQELPEDRGMTIGTGSQTVDSLLGKGMVPGSSVLLGGEPGVGKSTFLLQLLGAMSKKGLKTVYVSGEESPAQLKKRGERLQVLNKHIWVLNTIQVEDVLEILEDEDQPAVVVVDSVQTLISEQEEGLAGSLSQIRTVATLLQEAVKKTDSTIIFVGHVTKEGQLAGPKLLEHMVDTVLYLEGDKQHSYRVVRVIKNRFGPTSNILVLKMVEQGLQIVHDPSTFFLQARDPSLSGTALVMALEGQRPFAVEVQALVTGTFLSFPRRNALGFDTNRLHLLIAIMEKKLQLNFGQLDIYTKIGGGLKLQEPGMDLGLISALLSSYYDRPLPEKAIFWGEVDLSGQVRPVMGQEKRCRQAELLGYSPIFCPRSAESEDSSRSKKLQYVDNIFDLQRSLFSKK